MQKELPQAPRLAPRLALCCTLAFAVHGCRESTSASDSLLRMGDEVFALREMQALIDAMPESARKLYRTEEEKRSFINKMIQTQILAEEAKRLRYDRDPEIEILAKRAMALKLMKEKLGPGPPAGAVSDRSIESYYASHAAEFQRPEEAHVSEIVLDSAEAASRVRMMAVELDRRGGGEREDVGAFRDLVFEHSKDPQARIDGGDRTFIRGQRTNRPQTVVAGAFELSRQGEISPVLQTEEGFHVIRLRRRVPASQKSLAESRELIIRRLSDLARDKTVNDFVAALSGKLDVQVYEENFAKLRFDGPEKR